MIKPPEQPKPLFESDSLSALEAISKAQFIAFSPYVFQASVLLRDKGILKIIDASKNEGLSIDQIKQEISMSHYAIRVLLEAGLGIGLVYRKSDQYFLTKTGHFFINNQMSVVNTDFMRDVCYEGAKELEKSLEEGKPHGLQYLGNWET